MDAMQFDIDLIEVPVTLTTKTKNMVTGDIITSDQACVLVEMDGVQRDKWLNSMSKRSQIIGTGKDSVSRIVNFERGDAEMLGGCLLCLPTRTPMPVDAIQKLPARVLKALVETLHKISALDEDEKVEAEAKNALPGKAGTGTTLPLSSENPLAKPDAQ